MNRIRCIAAVSLFVLSLPVIVVAEDDGSYRRLQGLILEGLEWTDVQVSDSTMDGGLLRDCTARELKVEGGKATSPQLRGVTVEDVDWQEGTLSGSLERVELPQIRLYRCRGGEVQMRDCELDEVRLQGLSVNSVRLDGGTVREWRVEGLQARDVYWYRTDLTDAVLERVELDESRFEDCSLRGALMDGCDLTGARMEGCDVRGLVINGHDIEALIRAAEASR